jgi:prevent-host-death family protein
MEDAVKVKRVGVYEAKTQLPRLIEQVARGRQVTITRHGVPVAVLAPAERPRQRAVAEVIAELKTFGRGRRLGRLSLRRMIAEGRR